MRRELLGLLIATALIIGLGFAFVALGAYLGNGGPH